ncbi:unknown [Prevotella sp. CAG:1058]|nr:unknown [Prevotella sp. CAG:1058]
MLFKPAHAAGVTQTRHETPRRSTIGCGGKKANAGLDRP